MRIFITGATGFIGKHLLSLFQKEGHIILASALRNENIEIDKKNIQWLYENLEDIEYLKPNILSFNPEVVIHLAWFGIPDYSEKTSLINFNMSVNLLDFIIEETNCKKIIISGSCFEYGSQNGECKETDIINTTSYIAWAKNSLYEYVRLKCKQNLVEFIWFRIFYLYGPGQREGSLIPYLYKTLKNKEIPDIRSPHNKNDFIYIKDVVRAFSMAITSPIESGIYNLANGHSTSVHEICKIVEHNLSGDIKMSEKLKDIKQNEIVNFWADISKAYNAFGWEPKYTTAKGLKETVDFFKNNFLRDCSNFIF